MISLLQWNIEIIFPKMIYKRRLLTLVRIITLTIYLIVFIIYLIKIYPKMSNVGINISVHIYGKVIWYNNYYRSKNFY